MTTKNTGHFAAKHPADTKADPRILDALALAENNFAISCVKAHEIAHALAVKPKDVGVAIDLLEGRIQKCQLGLFGYGDKGKIVHPARHIRPEIQSAIEATLIDDCITCADIWQIADQLGEPRLTVANACETLSIRIIQCQIGAF
jgi:hypothetical protein